VHIVGNGDAFTAAGFDVKVYGEYHGAIHPDLPKSANVGFLVDDSLFHPGDALTVPERPIETLQFRQSPAEWLGFEVDPRCLSAAVEGGDEVIIAGGVELCHGSLG
jgi:hypothetical protein